MKKQLLAAIISVVMLLGMMSVSVSAANTTSGTCGGDTFSGELLTWHYQQGILTISGKGQMDDYSATPAPWNAFRDEITTVEVASGVYSISAGAFSNYSGLTDVYIAGVTSVAAGENGSSVCSFAGDTVTVHFTTTDPTDLNVITEIFMPEQQSRHDSLCQNCHITWVIGQSESTVPTNPGVTEASWQYSDGAWYYVDTAGNKLTEWQQIDGTWYYLNASGVMQTDWLNNGGIWYYLTDSGAMATDWVSVNGVWYYMSGSGAMQTGWINDGGTWYFLTGSGAMATGWVSVDGTWYYMSGSGAMHTGWLNDGGTWYYLYDSGSMATGWVAVNGTWYYMNGSGSMATDWLNLNGTWYYLNSDGSMVTGAQTIDGTTYFFDASGVWIG